MMAHLIQKGPAHRIGGLAETLLMQVESTGQYWWQCNCQGGDIQSPITQPWYPKQSARMWGFWEKRLAESDLLRHRDGKGSA